MNKKDFERGCFSLGWTVDNDSAIEQKQKKDLATLLLELEDIKKDFERIMANKDRLTKLLKFYDGSLLTEN